MAPVETDTYTLENNPFRNTIETFTMHPFSDGSLSVESFSIPDVEKPIEIIMKQAVRALEIGAPQKQACGDYLSVMSETVRTVHGPLLTATCTSIRDFLSLSPEDAEVWHETVTSEPVLQMSASLGVPLSEQSLPDEWTATYLRAHPNEYARHVFAPFRGTLDLPYYSLIHLANMGGVEDYRHNLHNIHPKQPVHFLYHDVTHAPLKLRERELLLFRPIDAVLQFAHDTLHAQFSPGICGDIQTLMIFIQINKNVWLKQFPLWKLPLQDVAVIFRSNADQITRISSKIQPQLLYADNNNFYVDETKPGSAHYSEKLQVYWMTGANTLQRMDMTSQSTPKGLPLFTYSVRPVYDSMKMETMTDGFILQPPEIYNDNYLFGGSRDGKSIYQALVHALQTGDMYEYSMNIDMLRQNTNDGWIIRNPDVMNPPQSMTREEFQLFLRIRNDLALQRPDDESYVSMKTG